MLHRTKSEGEHIQVLYSDIMAGFDSMSFPQGHSPPVAIERDVA